MISTRGSGGGFGAAGISGMIQASATGMVIPGFGGSSDSSHTSSTGIVWRGGDGGLGRGLVGAFDRRALGCFVFLLAAMMAGRG